MTRPPIEYWTTVAALMPALAAATVVEARRLIRRWLDIPWYIKTFQGTSWVLILVTMALAELACIATIRGVEPPPYLTTMVEWSIGGAIGMLFISPAMSYIGYAIVMGWTSLFGLRHLRRIAKTRRRLEDSKRRADEVEERATRALQRDYDIEATCIETKKTIDEMLAQDLPADKRKELLILRAKADQILKAVQSHSSERDEILARGDAIRDGYEELEREQIKLENASRNTVRELVKAVRKTLVRDLVSDSQDQLEDRKSDEHDN